MPTLFSKLNGRAGKPVHSRYGPGISSTDLVNFPPSPSSQDAPELAEVSKPVDTSAPLAPPTLSLDGPVLSERSPNLSANAKLRQPTDFGQQYTEFGAAPASLPRPSANQAALPVMNPRNHKTLPSKPVIQKPSLASTNGGKPMKTGEQTSTADKATVHPPLYGYTIIGWDKQMNIPKVAELVLMCGEQIRMRGLDSPLIFSSMALDLSQHNVTSLIRSYLTSPKDFYASETKFANPHDLAAVVKWALARLGRVFPVPIPAIEQATSRKGDVQEDNVFIHQRGFLEWDSYVAWSTYERNAAYPVAAFSAFLDGLPSSSAALLVALFSLLSSTTSYSLRNGMTPSRLARLFGALMFGLPEDETFEKTYDSYIKVSNATEHLLLAYIRDMSTMEPLPTRLADHVRSYPQVLAGEPNRPGRGVRGIPFTLASRAVRLYSIDLLHQAREWDLASRSPEWAACCGNVDGVEREPQLSDRYRKLINLRLSRRPAGGAEAVGGVGPGRHVPVAPYPTPDVEAYMSLADQAWDEFMSDGFTAPDQAKLAFDLHESERKARMQGRQSVQWSQFERSGFSLKDDGLESVLAFDDLLQQDVKRWPEERAELLDKLRKTDKAMPPFPYDTTPCVISSPSLDSEATGQWVQKPFSRMDDVFPEVYADILLGNGWSNRDELTHRNANFVIVQYKSRPSPSTVGAQGAGATNATQASLHELDERTDAAWFVIEEVVPAQYRSELEAAGRKKNRSRASLRNLTLFRRRKEMPAGDSFFDDVFRPGAGGTTKKMTLRDPLTLSPDPDRRDSQSSTIRGPVPSPQPDEGQFASSSVRLLTSLKSRASKRLRKAARDDDDAAPPPLPPKATLFVQQSTSWNSDDFETRSLHDPEMEAFASADTQRGKLLKSATMGKGERRRSKDDAWLDILVRNNGYKTAGQGSTAMTDGEGEASELNLRGKSRHGKAATDGEAEHSHLQSDVNRVALSQNGGKQGLSITPAGWSREDAPTPATPSRESSLQNLDNPEHKVSANGNNDKSSGAERTTIGSPSPMSAVSSMKSTLAKPEVSPKGQPSAPDTNSRPSEEDSGTPSLPYLRSLPPRGTSSDSERERARETRIEAAKERARELRAALNPVAVGDLERRREERSRNIRQPAGEQTATAALQPTSNNSTPVKATMSDASDVPSPSSTLSKPSPRPAHGSRDDPFAKDRFSGRVASLTSKFGGASAKPLTPQSTGNEEIQTVGSKIAGSTTSSAPITPSKAVSTPQHLPTSPSYSLATSEPDLAPTERSRKAVANNPLPTARQQDQEGESSSTVKDPVNVWAPRRSSSPSIILDPDEPNSRHSLDSSAIGIDVESIYPDDAASNFSRDTNPDEEAAGNKLQSQLHARDAAAPGSSLFSNLDQTPAMAGAAAAAAVAGTTSDPSSVGGSRTAIARDSLRVEAEDRPTNMPPGFRQRYQPGMPLSNVEEERESVLSGSNA